VGVEKRTKAVISANFSTYHERTFNNLQTNFVVEIPRKEFFNTHAWFQQLGNGVWLPGWRDAVITTTFNETPA
jgi:hypothetical protein